MHREGNVYELKPCIQEVTEAERADIKRAIAQHIKNARPNGIFQKDVAANTNMSERSVQAYENGENDVPGEHLVAFAAFYGDTLLVYKCWLENALGRRCLGANKPEWGNPMKSVLRVLGGAKKLLNNDQLMYDIENNKDEALAILDELLTSIIEVKAQI